MINPARPPRPAPAVLAWRLLLLGIVIPVLLGLFTYVGFFTNYTTGVFHQAGFEQQYLHSSIYRFRILGSHALLWTHELIRDWPLGDFAPYGLRSVDPNGTAQFYYAYFLLNTAFLCATCCVLVLTLSRLASRADFQHIELPVFCLALLMSFAQFVITPYDTLSYFFLAAALPLCLQRRPGAATLVALGILVVLGTLTRETVVLVLSFYCAVHWQRVVCLKPTREQAVLLGLVTLFLLTYLLLRWQLGLEDATHHRFRLLRNFSDDPLPIIGGLFLPAVAGLYFTDGNGRQALLRFLLASLPYTVMMFAVAYPWEIRLWVPLLLVMTVIKLVHHPIPEERSAS